MGNGLQGDIALDDIKLLPKTQGQCPAINDCAFENGLCAWRNTLLGDQFDWSLFTKGTKRPANGPKVDRTSGTAQGNYNVLQFICK